MNFTKSIDFRKQNAYISYTKFVTLPRAVNNCGKPVSPSLQFLLAIAHCYLGSGQNAIIDYVYSNI